MAAIAPPMPVTQTIAPAPKNDAVLRVKGTTTPAVTPVPTLAKLSPKPPSDIVAVEHKGQSLLFYVNENSVISYLAGNKDGIDNDSTPYYERKEILVNGECQKTACDTKQIAAVVFESKEGLEIRVYFASEDHHFIRELRKVGDNPWKFGRLGQRTKFRIQPGSSMSAQANSKCGLKVFCARDDSARNDGAAELDVFVKSADTETWLPVTITRECMEY